MPEEKELTCPRCKTELDAKMENGRWIETVDDGIVHTRCVRNGEALVSRDKITSVLGKYVFTKNSLSVIYETEEWPDVIE